MKRYRLTESNLRNMIHEAVVSVLKEAAPVFGNNNQGYGITNNGDMRRGGTGKRRSFPLTYDWDDPKYANTARSSNSGREFNLQKENRLRNMVREAIVDTLREEEEKKYKYLDDEQLSKKPKVVGKIDLPDEDWGAKAKRKISLNRDRKRR